MNGDEEISMSHIERVKEEIRSDWFSDHVAEIEGEEGFQVIYWRKPGTYSFQTKYILSGNNVFISGDIGEAVYTLTCAATLKNIKDFGLSYFTGKLSAFCEDRYDFDEKLAKKELKEYWEEYNMNKLEDGQEIYDGILSAIEESSSMESYHAWLMNVYQSTSADTDFIECVWDFGKKVSHRIIGYWVGLQMVIEQLEGQNEEMK